MRILVVGTERDLPAVMARLVRADATHDAVKRAEARLKAANPDVRFNRLKTGDAIFVPDEAVFKRAAIDSVTTVMTQSAVAQAKDSLRQLQERVSAAAKHAAAERETLTRHLKSRAVRTATDRDEVFRTDVERLREALAEEDAQAPDRTKALRKAISQIEADLTDLQQRFT